MAKIKVQLEDGQIITSARMSDVEAKKRIKDAFQNKLLILELERAETEPKETVFIPEGILKTAIIVLTE